MHCKKGRSKHLESTIGEDDLRGDVTSEVPPPRQLLRLHDVLLLDLPAVVVSLPLMLLCVVVGDHLPKYEPKRQSVLVNNMGRGTHPVVEAEALLLPLVGDVINPSIDRGSRETFIKCTSQCTLSTPFPTKAFLLVQIAAFH